MQEKPFFVEETDEPVPSFLATSPIGSPKSSRRNSRATIYPSFASTEELVPELVGQRRIITTTKTVTKKTLQPSASMPFIPPLTTTTTTTKTIVQSEVEAIPLTSAIEALIESEKETERNYSSDSEISSLLKDTGNSGDPPITSSYFIDDSPVGSPKDEMEFPPSVTRPIVDESPAAWRLAWGWGGLPKITRNKVKTKETTETTILAQHDQSSAAISPPASPALTTEVIVAIPPTPPLATPHLRASDLIMMTSPSSPSLSLSSLAPDSPTPTGSSWTRSLIRYFKTSDKLPNGEMKKTIEENVTIDGGMFLMDTIATIRQSDGGGTASELTDTGGNSSDSEDEAEMDEDEEEREYVDAKSDPPWRRADEDSQSISASPETKNFISTVDVESNDRAVAIMMDPEADGEAMRLRLLERHGSVSYETLLLVGDSEEDSMSVSVTVTGAPIKIPNSTVQEVQEVKEITILPDGLIETTTTTSVETTIPPSASPFSNPPLASPPFSTPPISSSSSSSGEVVSISEETVQEVQEIKETQLIIETTTTSVSTTIPSTPSPPYSPALTLSPSPSPPSAAPPVSTLSLSLRLPPTPSRPILSSPSMPPASSPRHMLSSSLSLSFPSLSLNDPASSLSSSAPASSTLASPPPSPPMPFISSPPISSPTPSQPFSRSPSSPPIPFISSLPIPSQPISSSLIPSQPLPASPPSPSRPIQEKGEKEREEKGRGEKGKEEKGREGMTALEVGNFKVELSLCASQLASHVNNKELVEATFNKFKVSYEDLNNNPAVLLTNQDLVFKFNDRLYPWSIAAPYLISVLVFHQPLKPEALEALTKAQEKSKRSSWGYFWPFRNQQKTAQDSDRPGSPLTAQLPLEAAGKIQDPNAEAQQLSAITQQESAGGAQEGAGDEDDDTLRKYTKKTLRPTSDQLKSLGLQPGANVITFSVSSTLQGTRVVTARMFLWDRTAKIVVSDIDGTITKSDVYGQIAPIIGRDWTHAGVAQLYSNIAKNGYRIVYLTSRAIGQAGLTRGFITSVKHIGEAGVGIVLPEGPIMLSPNRLLASINREVIRRNPEEFKIACLKDIKALFPIGSYNFYAGFGNRYTDAVAYGAVGIPKGRVFTINPMGVIININSTYKKSYAKLNEVVWEMFPPLHLKKHHLDEAYNDFNFWKHGPTSNPATPAKFDY